MAGERSTRRRFLQGLGGTAVGSAVVTGASGESRAASGDEESWPQFGYDAANTGHAPDNTGPAGDLREQWSAPLSGFLIGYGSLPVVDGVVYAGIFGVNGSRTTAQLFALDATDGTEQWATERSTYSSGPEVSTPPVVVDGTVYVGANDYMLYALDATDGTEQWSFRADGHDVGAPTVADSTVYVGSFDLETGAATAYALDAEDGAEQWTFRADAPMEDDSEHMGGTPAVGDGTVYIGSNTSKTNEGTLYALDAGDGTKQWDFKTDDTMDTSPAVVDRTVYVGGYDDTVYALDAGDGTEQWSVQTDGEVWSSPAVVDGTVYVGSYDGTVYALDAGDGTEQWTFQTDGVVNESPAVVDGTVYVGSSKLYALDAEDGIELGSFNPEGDVETSPAVVDGTVYIGDSWDNVYSVVEESERSTDFLTEIPLIALSIGGLGSAGAGAWLYKRYRDASDE